MRRKRGRDVVFVADRVLLLLAIEEEVVVEDKIAVLVVVTPSTYFRVKSSVVRETLGQKDNIPLWCCYWDKPLMVCFLVYH